MSAPDGLTAALAAWLPSQRWFGHKGHTIERVQVRTRETLREAGAESPARTEHLLLTVTLDDGSAPVYQVPLGTRAELPAELEAWVVPGTGYYDALRDPECISAFADALAAGRRTGSVSFRREDGVELAAGMSGRALGAEQSNTSVVLGEQLLLKVFRRVERGVNPDLELHRALLGAGTAAVAPVRAWFEGELDGEVSTYAMAQDYAANSADGWSMALASVRDLLAEADLHADELGTDFAGEAQRLGGAVAGVHAALAQALGAAPPAGGASPVPAMLERLDAALAVVPQLQELAPAARALLEAATEAAGDGRVQRVHGDLHLGQVLRTPRQWLLIDFEGEPAKALAERRQPDSVLRDVAGMLRSFDYAAHQQLLESPFPVSRQLEFRAREWGVRNADAFCVGYRDVAGVDPREHLTLLRAYELDKAVYEAVYESHNRPGWVKIPLQAIARLCGAPTAAPVSSEEEFR